MSGGQRQRVAIGRAIVREPKAFLFDEPLSNLDAALRVQMRLEIGDLHKKLKTTMIYVTHDQVEAMTMADKIVVVDKGEVAQIGSPLELYNKPNGLFVARFIGSPTMNLVTGPSAAKRGATTLGVRPEHVDLSTTAGEWLARVTHRRASRLRDFRLCAGRRRRGADDPAFRRSRLQGRRPDIRDAAGAAHSPLRRSGKGESAMKLRDRIAVVTGGARGIGAAIVDRYVAEGARVAIADIAPPGEAEIAARHGDKAFGVKLDVTDRASIERALAAVEARCGGLDILVNNAAVFDMAPIVEVTEASFDRVFAINVKGLFFTLQAAARRMIARGRGGKIINMASQAGRRGEALVSIYCASKAAVISLTQSAGLDLIKHRINVNGISPGVVDTPMWDEVDALFAKYEKRPLGEKKRLVGEAVPFGRMGSPADHAGAAVFLASADSDYVVAQTLNVDGGNWMS